MTAAAPRKKRTVPTKDKIEKIGLATARLHKLLKELGHTRNLEKTAATMPDARDRLSYVDKAMHEASETTISAVETSIPLTKSTLTTCRELSVSLSDVRFAEHGELVGTAVSRLGEIASAEEIIHHNLLRIMEAQEFRDVAGQMVNKIVDAAVEIESILLDLLKEYAPDSKDSLISSEGLTAGPALKGKDATLNGKDATLNGQDEVDDLLASLGF
jgi:chemotaxis protein CheZ